jgi:hypothetical protein
MYAATPNSTTMIAVSTLPSLLHEGIDSANDSAENDSRTVKLHRLTSTLDGSSKVVEANCANDGDTNDPKRDTALQDRRNVIAVTCVTVANVYATFEAQGR